MIVVYATRPEPGRDLLSEELGAGIGLIRSPVSPAEVPQGSSLSVDLRWGSLAAPMRDLDACLALVGRGGRTAQEMCVAPVAGWPTPEWRAGAVGIDRHAFPVDPHLPRGDYALMARLVEAQTGQDAGQAVSLASISLRAAPCVFEVPVPSRPVSEAFAADLSLIGYDVAQEGEALHLTLHWQARRWMAEESSSSCICLPRIGRSCHRLTGCRATGPTRPVGGRPARRFPKRSFFG